jgi:hypothetical protein
MIQHRRKLRRVRQRAFNFTFQIVDGHPALSEKTRGRYEIRRKTSQGTKLTTEMGGRSKGVVILPQDQTSFALFYNATRAAKPGMGLRRDKAVLRKIARQNLFTRAVIVA